MRALILALLPLLCFSCFAQSADSALPFDATPKDAVSPFGGLSIKPSRIELQAGSKGENISLYNSGKSPITYRIELKELGLSEAGNFRKLNPGELAPWSAAKYIRYSPRQVTLQPGQRQRVRIIPRAPRDTPTGEYRSHLSFYSIPNADEVDTESTIQQSTSNRQASAKVSVQYRINIPVLLRVGKLTGGTRISRAQITLEENGQQNVVATIESIGTKSDYVGMNVLDVQGERIGFVRGISVYPPSKHRTVKIPISDTSRPSKVQLVMQQTLTKTGKTLDTYNLN